MTMHARTYSSERSTTPFLLWHFSPGDKIKNCAAQFLAVCWIVHVEFKVHRPPMLIFVSLGVVTVAPGVTNVCFFR